LHSSWTFQAHRLFDLVLAEIEKSSKVSRGRIAEVLTRLAVASPDPDTRLSQAQLGRGEGLLRPYSLPADTVSRAVKSLAEWDLITAHPPRSDKPGRPYKPLQLGSANWAIIGISVDHDERGPTQLSVLATGLDGVPIDVPGYHLERDGHPYVVPLQGGVDLVEEIARVVDTLCDQPALVKRNILGVGVGIAGHVYDGIIREAFNDGMNDLALASELSKRLDRLTARITADASRIAGSNAPPLPSFLLPVIVDNDVNLLAVLETYRTRNHDERDMAVVAVFNEGVGAAIIGDGGVYRGGFGMAGELGHFLVYPEYDDDPSRRLAVSTPDGDSPSRGFGAPCHCGRHHHLDCYAPPNRIRTELGQSSFDDVASFEDVAAASTNPDSFIGSTFRKAGCALGIALAALVNLADPARILLYLPEALYQNIPGTAAALYHEALHKALRDHVFSNAYNNTTELVTRLRLNEDERQFIGAQAAATRVIDSLIQHAKRTCQCGLPPRRPRPGENVKVKCQYCMKDTWVRWEHPSNCEYCGIPIVIP
jgi:predicted NBD/HSP70 family sugar kinase